VHCNDSTVYRPDTCPERGDVSVTLRHSLDGGGQYRGIGIELRRFEECVLQPKPLKVLLTPRNEENPYLPHLRESLQALGVEVEWFESESTRSQTVNALLAPWRLWQRRRQGFEILHVHWVYKFGWPSVASIPVLRRLPRYWLGWFLALARTMGFTVVYTWHDIVPVVKVFDDDAKGRSAMVRHLDGVITITNAAKRDIVSRWNVPADRIDVIPEGPPEIRHRLPRESARRIVGVEDEVLISAFGHIAYYKGLDLLLEAARRLPDDLRFAIRIIGAAPDPQYAAKLGALVESLHSDGRDVRWNNRTFTDDELGELLSATDVVAIPFRWITNSATLRFSMAWGADVVVPRLDSLDDIPDAAATWFKPESVDGLADALERQLRAWPVGATERRDAALRWVTEWSWSSVGEATVRAYESARERHHR
jgi:glycosyltransferase involved in cell wall biosynthesis